MPSPDSPAIEPARRDLLFVSVVAWPLIPIMLGAAGRSSDPDSLLSRLLFAQAWVHVIVGIVAIVRAPIEGRSRLFVAMIALMAWLVNGYLTLLASLRYGGAPL